MRNMCSTCIATFAHIYLFSATNGSAGRSNFDKGLHNLITLIKKRCKIKVTILYIYISTLNGYVKTGLE